MELSFLFNDPPSVQSASERVEADACQFSLSKKFRFYYRFLRPVMPIKVRQWLQKSQSHEVDEQWYLPLSLMDQIQQGCVGTNPTGAAGFWPESAKYAFVLTHDVETSEGMQHISRIADAEEELGFRSSWNLVPYKYKIDAGLISDLQSRGFEIGIHGYNHDGQLYSSKRVFKKRASAINQAIDKYNAVGFRSPMVHRNLNWLQDLNIDYDSSCFDIDPFQAAPGGVGMIWPFVAGKFIELPYTMPQDHTLFIKLGERSGRIWMDKLNYIRKHQGMAMMLTHPDYLTGHRETEIYLKFLEHVSDAGEYWHATPQTVSQWWRHQDQLSSNKAILAN
ncbi:hypothetical protein N9B20_03280 [Mariniblastus sp.]|nr:hypothetical protein [Mariniblastus sp.]